MFVLDPFMGGGTTLIEAWLLNRYSIGVDISKLAYSTTMDSIARNEESLQSVDKRTSIKDVYRPQVIQGDSTTLEDVSAFYGVPCNSINLLCVHPPYLKCF